MNIVPNFTTEQIEKLNKEVQRLSDALKKVKGEKDNPLKKELIEVLEKNKEELLLRPFFFQALFLAAALGYDETIKLLEQTTETLKED